MRDRAAADQDILASLNGIVEMQRTIRRNALDLSVQTALVFLRIYYQRLPLSISRRLTELDSQVIAAIPSATGENGITPWWQELGDKAAGDAAFAQAIRAANRYREKLGLPLLGADGQTVNGKSGANGYE